MIPQDGEQSSEGGGGGGSGGAILIAAGGTVNIYGTLKAQGGKGAFGGFSHVDKCGGGGSGGRIAIFGESVSIIGDGSANVDGGSCGAYKTQQTRNVLAVNISMHLEMLTPLNQEQIVSIASILIKERIAPLREMETKAFSFDAYSGSLHSLVTLEAILENNDDSNFTIARIDDIRTKMNETHGVNLAQVCAWHVHKRSLIFKGRVQVYVSLYG